MSSQSNSATVTFILLQTDGPNITKTQQHPDSDSPDANTHC